MKKLIAMFCILFAVVVNAQTSKIEMSWEHDADSMRVTKEYVLYQGPDEVSGAPVLRIPYSGQPLNAAYEWIPPSGNPGDKIKVYFSMSAVSNLDGTETSRIMGVDSATGKNYIEWVVPQPPFKPPHKLTLNVTIAVAKAGKPPQTKNKIPPAILDDIKKQK